MRGRLNIFVISRVINTYSCGDLEPKTSEIGGRVRRANDVVPAALRIHVPEHTTWILPCALLLLVESTAQAKR